MNAASPSGIRATGSRRPSPPHPPSPTPGEGEPCAPLHGTLVRGPCHWTLVHGHPAGEGAPAPHCFLTPIPCPLTPVPCLLARAHTTYGTTSPTPSERVAAARA